VLVPVLNEGDDVRQIVAAMQEQSYPYGEVELIFADGLSEDSTRDHLEQAAAMDPRIKVLDNPRRGTASGLNVCLGAARCEYVARMDAHTIYPERYLALGVERLRRGDVGWVAGPQVPTASGRIGSAVAAALETPLGRGGSRKWEAAGQGTLAHGVGDEAPGRQTAGAQTAVAPQPLTSEYDLDTGVFCGVWRRDELLEVGGFDEGWPRNQDSELAARFLRRGRRIVCLPEMAASYRPRESLRGLWRQYREYGAYRAKTARRHPTSLRRSAVLPPLLVLDAVAAALVPRALGRLARAGAGLYGAALTSASLQAVRHGRRGDALLLPVVLVTMHAAHGLGFLEGAARWGVPWAALLRIAGLRADAGDEGPYAGSVSAPSLAG